MVDAATSFRQRIRGRRLAVAAASAPRLSVEVAVARTSSCRLCRALPPQGSARRRKARSGSGTGSATPGRTAWSRRSIRRQAGFRTGARSRRKRAVPHRALHERTPRQRQFPGRRSGLSRLGAACRHRRDRRSDPRGAAGHRHHRARTPGCPISTGTPNPLLSLPHLQSPNLSLAVDLDGGFDALLGARQRQAQAQEAPLADAQVRDGRRLPPHRGEDARARPNALLDAFFAMKEVRFRKMGIANVFGDAEVSAFFRALFAERARRKPKPSFVLHALEVGGKHSRRDRLEPLAATPDLRIRRDRRGRAWPMPAPANSCSSTTSRKPARRALDVYDFSVGDEPYKRLWCDIEIRQFDVVVPLTAKRPAAGAARCGSWRG